MAFDKFFKQLIKTITGGGAVSGYSIGTLEWAIDIVLPPNSNRKDMRFLPEFLKNTNMHYIIEFKSARDKCSESDFIKTAIYKLGYALAEKIPPDKLDELQGILMVVKSEPWFENYKRKEYLLHTEIPGVYITKFGYIDRLVIINELPVEEQYLGLLLNASGPKLLHTFRYMKNNGLVENPTLVNYIYTKCFLINGREERFVMDEVNEILGHEYDWGIKNAVNIIGLEKVINVIGFDKVLEVIGIEKMIEMVGIEKVIKAVGIEKLIDYVDNEKILALLIKKNGKKAIENLLNKLK